MKWFSFAVVKAKLTSFVHNVLANKKKQLCMRRLSPEKQDVDQWKILMTSLEIQSANIVILVFAYILSYMSFLDNARLFTTIICQCLWLNTWSYLKTSKRQSRSSYSWQFSLPVFPVIYLHSGSTNAGGATRWSKSRWCGFSFHSLYDSINPTLLQS